MSVDNVWSDDWPPGADWSGGGSRSRPLPRGEQLGASVYELGPGNWVPFHFHHASEELLVVLRGAPTVRLHDGDRQLQEGEVVGLPRGPGGGHQIRNESAEVARVLIVSTNADPDVAEYDSGKVGIWTGGEGRFFRLEDAVEHGGPE
jgi:uncharacterized cupin superfamily protein